MSEPYKGLNAALARNSGPSAEDVDALTAEERHDLTNASCRAHRPGTETFICHPCADAEIKVLERILAAHTAAAEACGAERGARAVVEWLTTDAAEEAAAAGIADYAYPGLSQVECERAANAALSTLATAAARVVGGA